MRLSVQLYTLRDHLTNDFAGTLRQVRETGLEYVELAGMYGKTTDETKAILDDLGLKVNATHIGLDLLQGSLDTVIADAKTLGIPYIVLPWVSEEAYGIGWGKFGKSLEPIAQTLKDAGLGFAYHNHAFEFVQQEGRLGMDAFYEDSDPELVKAQLDLAWVHIGGQDPAGYVKKFAGRTPLTHLKDYDPAKDPQWVPAGTGVLGYETLAPMVAELGVEFGAIELDAYAGDPLDAVKQSVTFFNGLGIK